jgi:hypothetical protein
MKADMQTQICGINFDARRKLKGLPDILVFEKRELDGTYTQLASISSGWIADEVVGETFGGAVEEYQVLAVWNSDLDVWVKQCTGVLIGSTRYEKRAVDPAIGSPAIIRLRCQPITGYASF